MNRFWAGRRVLLTGHTGFKGGWAALLLHALGADVTGLALAPETTPSLCEAARVDGVLRDDGPVDLRDAAAVAARVRAARPDLVLHMGAQALVRRSYREPRETFEINVMGTTNLLDALRDAPRLQAVLVVTSDKVYENDESGRAFAETDRLGGHDPYAASKAAAEIVVASYRRAFFEPAGVPLATVRGGNVIGGGDFSADRVVPDLFRAARAGTPLRLRHPDAVRPWQHVLDCIGGYLLYLEALAGGGEVPSALNIGPDPRIRISVRQLVEAIAPALGSPGWAPEPATTPAPREMRTLSLDPALARAALGWSDRLPGGDALRWTAEWYAAFLRGADARALTMRQIEAYRALAGMRVDAAA